MSHSNILEVRVPAATPTPRIVGLVSWTYDAMRSLARSLTGQAASAHPRIAEASAVRQMADRLIYSDPALAADLYAAASRHERFDEDAARR